MSKKRLDQWLTENGHAPSRSRARDMVLRGCVRVNGIVAMKHAMMINDDAVQIDDPAQAYVSRAALKLLAGLEQSDINVEGRQALDLGASTGGFTQVLLERGADHVTAVDVGHGQMHPSLRNNKRVTCLEKINARDLTVETLGGNVPDIIVSDLSFVSLKIAAEPALLLAHLQAHCVLLVKPQFEVGRDGVGKGGLVSDTALIDKTNASLRNWLDGLSGWQVTHFLPSPISGGDGNKEFLMCGARTR